MPRARLFQSFLCGALLSSAFCFRTSRVEINHIHQQLHQARRLRMSHITHHHILFTSTSTTTRGKRRSSGLVVVWSKPPSSSAEQDSTTSNGNSYSNSNSTANAVIYTLKVLLGTAVIILLTSFFAHTALTIFTSMPPQTLSDFLTVIYIKK